jgi:hypothetical protein
MSGEDSKSNSVTKLTSSNYPTWQGEMKAHLQVKGLWWDDFFSIQKQPDESLSTLIARIEDGMSKSKELRPTGAKTAYTIEDCDAELICMTMVRSLGQEYSHFVSSLMLLKSLDKSELQAPFLAEESQCRRRPEGPGGDVALFTASATCHCCPGATCYFCQQPGHWTHKCHAFKQAKTNAKANAGRSGEGRCPKNAHKASEVPAASPTPPASSTTTPGTCTASQNTQHMSQSAQSIRESAGNVSLCSFDPSHPLCPLQLDADTDWNANTGATSHMTPHHHWLRNFAPRRYSKNSLTLEFTVSCTYILYSKTSLQYLEFTVSCTKSKSVNSATSSKIV